MRHITMKQAIFYRLLKLWRAGIRDFIAVDELAGVVQIPELGGSRIVSHEVSARVSEIFAKNPYMLEREWMRGTTGATYYGYRIAENFSAVVIKEKRLRALYEAVVGV